MALVLCIHDVSTSLNYLTRYDGRSRILKLLPFFREGLSTVSRSTGLLNSLLSMQLTACMGLPLHYMQFTCTTLRCGHKFEWQGDSESHFTMTGATLCVACCSSDSWESYTGWSGPWLIPTLVYRIQGKMPFNPKAKNKKKCFLS